MICTACGHENSDDSQYCSQCGLPLSIEEAPDADAAERPVLSGVVPYVIDGQKTGAIPGRDGEDAEDEVPAECCDTSDSPTEAEGSDSAETDDSDLADGKVSENVVSDSSEEEAARGDAVQGDAGEADANAAEGGPFHDDSAQDDRLHGPAGVASWDREFPTAQMTAVMPKLDDGDPEGGEPEDDDEPVRGKHASGVDRTAVTERLSKVEAPLPDSTAVIPSLSSKGSKNYSDGPKHCSDPARKIPMKWVKAAIAVLVVILLAVGVKLAFFNTQIPQVVDTTSSEARARLTSAGFEVEVKSEAVDGVEDGTVLACEPECGTRHRKGSTVTITVASSQTIPDVVGMDLDAAREMLEEQGATNIKESLKKSNQPENTVIAVSPDVDQAFDLDDEIVLTVATTAYLPDVVGSSEGEAKKTLEEAGYAVDVKWTESEKEPGTVVSTKPKAKELANLGSTVTVAVASPGPSDFLHVMEYFEIKPEDLSDYLKWKDFVVAGSFQYTNDWSGKESVSQKWSRSDGVTISFTPAPYIEDNVLDMADYMAQGREFEGVRIFIPAKSDLSLGTDLTTAKVKEYMQVCGLEGMSDSCTKADLDYNGQSGKDLGMDDFICAQGTQNGKVWTILITADGTYIGTGGYECYEDMEPICDWVAVNEIFQAR